MLTLFGGRFLLLVRSASQNSVLKTWQGKPENVGKAQEALLKRAKANSDAQLGKYDPATEGSTEAAKSLYEKGYKVGRGADGGLLVGSQQQQRLCTSRLCGTPGPSGPRSLTPCCAPVAAACSFTPQY